MSKIRFIGESDDNFTNRNEYKLINIQADNFYIITFISNNDNKIVFIPYDSLELFNKNWEVINE